MIQLLWAQEQIKTNPPMWGYLLLYGGIAVIFYFFTIKPQRKKIEQEKKLQSELKVGDQVLTKFGLFGKITSLDEQSCSLEIAPETQVKILKGQILERRI